MISKEEVLKHAQKILDEAEELNEASQDYMSGVRANGCKSTISAFLQKFAGNKSSFYQEAKSAEGVILIKLINFVQF